MRNKGESLIYISKVTPRIFLKGSHSFNLANEGVAGQEAGMVV